jgi:hypothetical protein
MDFGAATQLFDTTSARHPTQTSSSRAATEPGLAAEDIEFISLEMFDEAPFLFDQFSFAHTPAPILESTARSPSPSPADSSPAPGNTPNTTSSSAPSVPPSEDNVAALLISTLPPLAQVVLLLAQAWPPSSASQQSSNTISNPPTGAGDAPSSRQPRRASSSSSDMSVGPCTQPEQARDPVYACSECSREFSCASKVHLAHTCLCIQPRRFRPT